MRMALSPGTSPVVFSGIVTIGKMRGNCYSSVLGVSFSQRFRGRMRSIASSCVRTEGHPGTHLGSGGLGKGDLRSLFWNVINRH